MARSLRQVQPGERMAGFPAAAYNTIVEMRRFLDERARKLGSDPLLSAARNTSIVDVKNDSGGDRDQFDVLGVSGAIFTPTESPDEFKAKVMLTGITPTTTDHAGKFAVSGKVGKACIAGGCPARITGGAVGDKFADVKNGDATSLLRASSGTARILYHDTSTGYAYVLLGASTVVNTAGLGTLKFQVYQMTSNTGAGWDYIRAHG
jgi:hypothetical protein